VDIFTLEKLYIKAVKRGNPADFRIDAGSFAFSEEVQGLLVKFAATAVVEIISHYAGA
jgi:hypothetical protein